MPDMFNKILKIGILLSLFLSVSNIYAKEFTNSREYIQKYQKDLPKQCIFFFQMYINAKSPKAFAYAIDNSYKYTCRFSSGSDSLEKAKEVALRSCNKSREKRGIKSECKLYNANLKGFVSQRAIAFQKRYNESIKKIVDELNKLKKLKKEKKNNSKKISQKQSTDKKTEKIKNRKKDDNILKKLPKPCHMFYKLYKDAPPFKAFAIAIDSDKRYVCKFSAKSNSLQKAKDIALRSCKKSKISRKVKNSCKIFDYVALKTATITKKIQPKRHKTIKIKKRVRDSKLEQAILNTDLKEIKRLIKNGANIDTEADDHSRALFVATAKGDVKFVKELLEKGAYPFFTKGDGNNLLVAAVMSGKLELLKIFLELGVDPNQQCNEGNTPLHFAFMMFYDDMMKELYKAGADDNIPNDKGETVRSMAKEYHVNLKKIKSGYGNSN